MSARGIWVFQVTGALKQHFAALIASQPQTDATKLLLRQRGIASVSIQLAGGLGTALPYSADSIQIVVLPVKGL